MSRRAMIFLILAIAAVHAVLLWLFLATGSAERQLSETLREIEEEENALRSEMAGGEILPSGTAGGEVLPSETQTEASSSARKPPASAAQTASVQPGPSVSPDRDPTASLPAVKEKPAPSVPSTTYVRKPKKTASVKLDFTGAARDNISGIKGINLATAGILIDLDNNKVLWAKNPSKTVPIASLSKIMTIMLAYEIAMDDSSPYTLESLIPVTTEAINTEASKVDFKKGEMFTIRELLVAASVKSANDAAHLLAEHLGGGTAAPFA